MNISQFFDPKKTKQLICFYEYFKFFKTYYFPPMQTKLRLLNLNNKRKMMSEISSFIEELKKGTK